MRIVSLVVIIYDLKKICTFNANIINVVIKPFVEKMLMEFDFNNINIDQIALNCLIFFLYLLIQDYIYINRMTCTWLFVRWWKTNTFIVHHFDVKLTQPEQIFILKLLTIYWLLWQRYTDYFEIEVYSECKEKFPMEIKAIFCTHVYMYVPQIEVSFFTFHKK